MSKLENQWIEIFRAGDYAAQGKFTEADLDQIVRNYQASNPEFEDAPATIGHPEGSGAPAWAWWSAIKREGKLLLGKMKDVQPQFEEMVGNRMFPKRSIGLVKRASSGWNLQHVAFLGAKAPQVKGLADCKFFDRTAGLMRMEFEEKFDRVKAMKGVNSRFAVDENSVKLHEAVTEFCEREKVDYATGCAKVLENDSRFSAPETMKRINSRYAVDENSVKLHEAVTEFCEREKVDYATGCAKVLENDSRFSAPETMKRINSRYAVVDQNSVKLHEAVTQFCETEKVDYLTGCFKVLEKHPELGSR